jgi:hypothetical protein
MAFINLTQTSTPLWNEQGGQTGYNQYVTQDQERGQVDIIEDPATGKRYATWGHYGPGGRSYTMQEIDAGGNLVGQPRQVERGSEFGDAVKDLAPAAAVLAMPLAAQYLPGLLGGTEAGASALTGWDAAMADLAASASPFGAEAAGGAAAGGAAGAAGAASTGLGNLSTSDLLKAGAGVAGAIAGAKPTTQESTQTKKLDPRLDEAVYGQGGLLSRAQGTFNATPQSGQNATMVQGQNMLRGLLGNPAVMQGLMTMGGKGMNLLEQQVAGNPLANWKPRGW